MLFGKAGTVRAFSCAADADHSAACGRSLCGDPVGREPTEKHCFFLNGFLLSIVGHGTTAKVQTARMNCEPNERGTLI